jgi:hypothetical protein
MHCWSRGCLPLAWPAHTKPDSILKLEAEFVNINDLLTDLAVELRLDFIEETKLEISS